MGRPRCIVQCKSTPLFHRAPLNFKYIKGVFPFHPVFTIVIPLPYNPPTFSDQLTLGEGYPPVLFSESREGETMIITFGSDQILIEDLSQSFRQVHAFREARAREDDKLFRT